MKKILLIALLAVASFNSFANLTQGNWKWSRDDGTETTATDLAAENTAPTVNSMENIRLRIQLFNSFPDPYSNTYTLQYSTDPLGPFTQITTSEANAFALTPSTFVSDGEVTTQQLASQPGYVYVPGQIVTSINPITVSLNPNEETEIEYNIKPTAATLTNTTYYFKVPDADSLPPLPNLKTGATLPISLTNFNVSADGNRVKVMWTTASEQNNDRFEIQRSANGKDSWQVVATEKGSGTTTQSHTYTAYDEHPLNGINYYRLKQYDLDGKSKESEIRSITMQMVKALVSAYPNPTKGDINFTVNNYSGNSVTAILSDMKGSMVHQEIVPLNVGASNYKLNLKSKPAPGMYVLQLKGDDFEKSINVVVQ